MFGRIFLARAYLAARPSLHWQNVVDYGERVVEASASSFPTAGSVANAWMVPHCAAMTVPVPPVACVSASNTTCMPAVRPSLPSTLGSGYRGDHGIARYSRAGRVVAGA